MTERSRHIFAFAFLIVAFAGFVDAAYLAVQHYRNAVPPCSLLEGCEQVTTSEYSAMFGVPVALIGTIYYAVIMFFALGYLDRRERNFLMFLALLTPIGFLASVRFVYLQLYVIKAICLYCMFSAATSTLLFIIGIVYLARARRNAQRLPLPAASDAPPQTPPPPKSA